VFLLSKLILVRLIIPFFTRKKEMELLQTCQAISTKGKPCKKKVKKDECFCNTHLLTKNSQGNHPADKNSNIRNIIKKNSTREVEIKEIRGIPYYIDKIGNVYKHEEIQQDNPSIIGQYDLQTGSITFVDVTHHSVVHLQP